jgi:hypothetical protein
MSREKEIKTVETLNAVLNFGCPGHEVRYDAGDSGMTEFYFNGILYKKVENARMGERVCVGDYKAPAPLLMGNIKTQEQFDSFAEHFGQ